MTQDASFQNKQLIREISRCHEGETSNEQVIDHHAFLNSQVVFPSVDEASEDGAVSPLMQDTEGNPVMRCLLLLSIPEAFRAAPHFSVVPGYAIIQSITDAGIVIDFGADHQFGLSKEQVGTVRDEILAQMEQE